MTKGTSEREHAGAISTASASLTFIFVSSAKASHRAEPRIGLGGHREEHIKGWVYASEKTQWAKGLAAIQSSPWELTWWKKRTDSQKVGP